MSIDTLSEITKFRSRIYQMEKELRDLRAQLAQDIIGKNIHTSTIDRTTITTPTITDPVTTGGSTSGTKHVEPILQGDVVIKATAADTAPTTFTKTLDTDRLTLSSDLTVETLRAAAASLYVGNRHLSDADNKLSLDVIECTDTISVEGINLEGYDYDTKGGIIFDALADALVKIIGGYDLRFKFDNANKRIIYFVNDGAGVVELVLNGTALTKTFAELNLAALTTGATFTGQVNFANDTIYKVESDGDAVLKNLITASVKNSSGQLLIESTGSYLILKSPAAGGNMYLDSGGRFIFRDRDDSEVALMELATTSRTFTLGAVADKINATFNGRVSITGLLSLPVLTCAPGGVANGDIWMEADGLHIYYNGAEKLVAGV